MDGDRTAGGVGRQGLPIADGAPEKVGSASEADGTAAGGGAAAGARGAGRGAAPAGRFQVAAGLGHAPAAPSPAERTPPGGGPAAGAAPIAAAPRSGRMQVLGAMAQAPVQASEAPAGARAGAAFRAGAFESAGQRMWSALGPPGSVVDPKVAKEVLPPPVHALLERMRAAGAAPTVVELKERWLAEAQSVEIRGANLDDLVAYAKRMAAAEVGGLLGTDPNATIDPATARARLPAEALATVERLRAAGGKVTLADLARARAADVESAIRAAAGDGKLSKKETRTLPEGIQTIIRTYHLEARGPRAVHRDAEDAARAVGEAAGPDAAQRVRATSGANPDGILSRRERKRLEAAEREAALGRWLSGGGAAEGPEGLRRFLSDSVSGTLARAFGGRDDAAIDDAAARRALPSDFYAAYRRLAGPGGTRPVTVSALRAALLADVERDAAAALADGTLSPNERARLARYVDPAPVATLRAEEAKAREERDAAVKDWRREVEERYPAPDWLFAFLAVVFFETRQEIRRREEKERREKDVRRRTERKGEIAKENARRAQAKRTFAAETQRKDAIAHARRAEEAAWDALAAALRRVPLLEACVQSRPLVLPDGTVVRLERRPFAERGFDRDGLGKIVPASRPSFLSVQRGGEAVVASTAPEDGRVDVGYFVADPAAEVAPGRARLLLAWSGALDPRKPAARAAVAAEEAKLRAAARLVAEAVQGAVGPAEELPGETM